MLTADLVQASVRRGAVRPHYIDATDSTSIDLAGCLIDIFQRPGRRCRRDVQTELDDFLGSGTEFLLHRGLAKLLFDGCEFEVESSVDPVELRRAVFEQAAKSYEDSSSRSFDRSAALSIVEERLSVDRDQLERSFYADLKEEQCLVSFRETTPERLLKRYNVALAQAVLLRATSLEVEISQESPRRYRELFRSIKFFQLLHTAAGNAKDGYRIRLDGPFSLFKASQRYGLQMANFLPTLLNFECWKLEAEVLWGKDRTRRQFQLDATAGLESHRHLKGQWQPEEIGWFLKQFSKLQSDWSISPDTELVDLHGGGVLVPDYVFTHTPTGTQVFLEIFGFWRRGALESRLELLQKHGPKNLILALSRELHADQEVLENLPGEVYTFRSHPIAREVLGLLEGFVAAE